MGALAELIARLVGQPIAIQSDAGRVRPKNSEVERLLADNTLARTLLGWEPLVGLEEGLQRTIEWMREHVERYRAGVYVL
jgi:dTDP-glucose 4,6-dehydratase